MRNHYTFIITAFILMLVQNTNAQPVEIVTGLDAPSRIDISGNELYFVQEGRISKIDITLGTPPVTDVITGLNEPNGFGLIFNGNDLYISQTLDGKISKIDITDPTPILEDILTGLSFPNKFVLNGNELYFSQTTAGKISKIDITDPTPILEDVITGLDQPNGMVLNGNDLYIAEWTGNKISKIDISQTTPTAIEVITGLSRPVALALDNNELFIAEGMGNKISKINITDVTPNLVDVLTGLNEPIDLIFFGNDLFFSERAGNKISKLENATLSTIDYSSNFKIRLYPNPSKTNIQVSGLINSQNYKIYGANGIEILNGTLSNNKKINIENLANGFYLLALENGNTIKFIKV
ncbi:putative secreted protein (Por secretion system target) [Winogradskyella pacifica]|uniref:Putative secreted protein (Por secretion system target) n=1 Tax=Winogradskyella pacifica TaxID=664642 RepID=A0A3D9MXJ4_9FLAO|nr:T9SS type A sorting domain-containing protein [Winogradskyella pacifica]REE24853.1 putative secreted protein (Por secretion system target) [Winogradskyella pacifica]